MNDLLDSQTFAEIKKFENFCYRKGFRNGMIWANVIWVLVAGICLLMGVGL
jgi:hypothetical protein